VSPPLFFLSLSNVPAIHGAPFRVVICYRCAFQLAVLLGASKPVLCLFFSCLAKTRNFCRRRFPKFYPSLSERYSVLASVPFCPPAPPPPSPLLRTPPGLNRLSGLSPHASHFTGFFLPFFPSALFPTPPRHSPWCRALPFSLIPLPSVPFSHSFLPSRP